MSVPVGKSIMGYFRSTANWSSIKKFNPVVLINIKPCALRQQVEPAQNAENKRMGLKK